MRIRLAISALLVALTGCNDNPGPPVVTVTRAADTASATPKPASSLPPPAREAGPAPVDTAAKPAAGELAWEAPPSFKKVDNPSKMRRATYEAPKVGSDAEAPTMSVIVAGGGVDANIDRWVGQFDDAAKSTLKKDKKTVGAYEVTVVEMKGTFSGGGGMMAAPGAPQAGWALLGAVVPVGDDIWFFKMTGPEASVAGARADFDKLVGSFHPAP